MIIGIIFVFVFICNILYKLSPIYKNEYNGIHNLKNISDGFNVLFVGSGSSKFAFDKKLIRKKAENISVWPEDFRYDYKLAKEYIHFFDEKQKILIQTISPLSFAKNGYLDKDDFSLKYVDLLSYKDTDLPRYKYFLEKYFPLIAQPKRILKCLAYCKNKKLDNYIEECSYKEKIERSDQLVEIWLKQNDYLVDFKSINKNKELEYSFKKNINWLNAMHDMCINNAVEYYCVILPMGSYLLDFFSDEFLNYMIYDNLKATKIPEERIINFLNKESLQNMDLYSNGLFLNLKGRQVIAKEMNNLLDEI